MLKFLRPDPEKKLLKQYQAKMEQARDQQRNGDVVAAARITAEAEEIGKRLDALRARDPAPGR